MKETLAFPFSRLTATGASASTHDSTEELARGAKALAGENSVLAARAGRR